MCNVGWLDAAALRLLQRVHQDDPDLRLQAQCNHRHSQYGKISGKKMATSFYQFKIWAIYSHNCRPTTQYLKVDPDLCLQAQCNHRHSQYGKISVRNMATSFFQFKIWTIYSHYQRSTTQFLKVDPDLCLQAQCNHRHSQYSKISVRNMATLFYQFKMWTIHFHC